MEDVHKMSSERLEKLLGDDVWKLQKNKISYLVDKNSKI
jgi:hypothetical protein